MFGHLVHQSAVLDEVEEVDGIEQPARGVIPADKGFHSADITRLQVHLRLVVKQQLVFDESLPQLLDRPHPFLAVDVVGPGIDPESFPGMLGLVHRHVSAPEQQAEVAAVLRGERDPDAHSGVQGDRVEGERGTESGPQLDCYCSRLSFIGIGEKYGEFVPSEARQQVAFA